MKRLPELQPLSREHQSALALARQAKMAGDSGDAAACAALRQQVLSRYAVEIAPHFAVEEQHLLPALARAGETELVARIQTEHAAIDDALQALVMDRAAAKDLIRFGELLTQHVRFEERVLFETAQMKLPASELEVVRQASARKGMK